MVTEADLCPWAVKIIVRVTLFSKLHPHNKLENLYNWKVLIPRALVDYTIFLSPRKIIKSNNSAQQSLWTS
jgi:hypothetical protein